MLLSVLPLLSSQLLWLQTHAPLALPSIPPGHEVTNASVRPKLQIFHPSSNSCVFRQLPDNNLKLGPCEQTDSWKYTPQKFLTVSGTYFCLKAEGPGLPAVLGIRCEVSDSQWTPVPGSQTSHLATKTEDGSMLCLDVDDGDAIVTNSCSGFSGDGEAANRDSQWFQISSFSYQKDQGVEDEDGVRL